MNAILNTNNAISDKMAREELHTYRDVVITYQRWTSAVSLEWHTETKTLVRVNVSIQEKNGARTYEINRASNWSADTVNELVMHFSGLGALSVKEAEQHLKMLKVTYEVLTELQHELDRKYEGILTMPEIADKDIGKTLVLTSK